MRRLIFWCSTSLKTVWKDYVRARWRGWKGTMWLVSGLGYSGLRSASSFSVGAEGATTVSGSIAASLARDTSYKTTAGRVLVSGERKSLVCITGRKRWQNTHLVSKGLEFTCGAGIQVHELVSVYQQGCFLALVLILEGGESSALHLKNTGQISYVALKSQEPSPDLTAGRKRSKNEQKSSEFWIIVAPVTAMCDT